MKTIGILLICAAIAAADPIYTVAGLGSGPSTGYAINSSGTVAGAMENTSGINQAFVSAPTGLRALSSNGSESYGYGINNAGTVAGITYVNGQAEGTIWSASGTTLLGAGSYAMAINNSGEVVGGNGSAFTDVNGLVQDLETTSGVDWSAAYGVNDAGTVVGDGRLSNGTFRGMVWSPGGAMTMLGTFGGTSSQATAVSDSGEVVGFASLADGYQNAFAWSGGAMVDLGTLGLSSYAYGVNNSGEVVGYSYLADGAQDAFLYDDGTMLDLNSLIPANSGWELLAAYGINDGGQITGLGLYDGQLTAFLLTDPPPAPADPSPVPEPRDLAALVAALAGIVFVRERSVRGGGEGANPGPSWAPGAGERG